MSTELATELGDDDDDDGDEDEPWEESAEFEEELKKFTHRLAKNFSRSNQTLAEG